MALQNLRSSTPSKRPDASSMSDGQIALNTAAASAGLFFKDSNGDLVKTGPVHIGTTAPNSTPAAGGSTGNSKGEAWLDTSNNNYVLKIYDGTSWQSAEIAPGSARQLLQTNAAGTDVEFTSNVDVPGTLDVTGATTLDSTASVAGLLSADGKISFAEGNAAAPGIYPGSDTDTGISSPSLDTLSLSTAGTSRLYIDSSGDVGIGTSSPDYALDVRSGDGRFKRSASNEAAIYLGNTANNYIYGTSDSNLITLGTNGSEKLRIDSSGNVGIGTSSPGATLDVNGSARIGADDTSDAELQIGSGATGNRNSYIDFIGDLTYTDYGLRVMRENAGANATSELRHRGTGELRITTAEAAPITFRTTSGERARITSSGNFGIGTSSPGSKLHILNSGQATTTLNTAGDLSLLVTESGTTVNNGGSIVFGAASGTWRFAAIKGLVTTGANNTQGDVAFLTRGASTDSTLTERMRITSSGNVGIGTSSPSYKLDVECGPSSAQFTSTTNWNFSNVYIRRKASNVPIAKMISMMLDGDSASETNFTNNLTIWGTYNSTPTTGSTSNGLNAGMNLGAPGGILFHTNGSEKARIDSDGGLFVGATSGGSSGGGTVKAKAYNTKAGYSGALGSSVFNINWTGSAAQLWIDTTNVGTFTLTSDYRVKDNIASISTDCIDRIKQLRPVQYQYADYGDIFVGDDVTREGFIAHEVAEVIPSGVEGEKDDPDKIQSLKVDAILSVTVKALQEAIAKIETLEQRLADAGL